MMIRATVLSGVVSMAAFAGANAADVATKAAPVQYVKFCSLYGAGFYYIPGADTCIKIGGYVRAEWNYQANGTFSPVHVYNFDFPGRNRFVDRVRGGITV